MVEHFKAKDSIILQWANAKGYSGTARDAMLQHLQESSNLSSGTISDHLDDVLNQLGYTGTIEDKLSGHFISTTGISNPKDAERNFFSNSSNDIGSPVVSGTTITAEDGNTLLAEDGSSIITE